MVLPLALKEKQVLSIDDRELPFLLSEVAIHIDNLTRGKCEDFQAMERLGMTLSISVTPDGSGKYATNMGIITDHAIKWTILKMTSITNEDLLLERLSYMGDILLRHNRDEVEGLEMVKGLCIKLSGNIICYHSSRPESALGCFQ